MGTRGRSPKPTVESAATDGPATTGQPAPEAGGRRLSRTGSLWRSSRALPPSGGADAAAPKGADAVPEVLSWSWSLTDTLRATTPLPLTSLGTALLQPIDRASSKVPGRMAFLRRIGGSAHILSGFCPGLAVVAAWGYVPAPGPRAARSSSGGSEEQPAARLCALGPQRGTREMTEAMPPQAALAGQAQPPEPLHTELPLESRTSLVPAPPPTSDPRPWTPPAAAGEESG